MPERCYCRKDLMCRCEAGSWENQRLCKFYIKHSYYDRCSHDCTQMNHHCDNHRAQAYGFYPDGEVYGRPAEVSISSDRPERSCRGCLNFACAKLIQQDHQAQVRGGLTVQDLINIAGVCQEYCDAETLMSSINS